MTEPTEPKATYDGSITEMIRSLINGIIKDSESTHGETALERVRNQLQFQTGGTTLEGITALSAYLSARAAERQAIALESLAKTARAQEMSEAVDTNAQAIIDQRESKREYLATTYSLDYETLTFLWAMRGILVDASIKSLSRPDRFDPYRRVTNDEIAWTLRITSEQLWWRLPRKDGETAATIDYDLLDAFDIQHYGGDDIYPDEWLYSG